MCARSPLSECLAECLARIQQMGAGHRPARRRRERQIPEQDPDSHVGLPASPGNISARLSSVQSRLATAKASARLSSVQSRLATAKAERAESHRQVLEMEL